MRDRIFPCILACVLAGCQPHGPAARAPAWDRQAAQADHSNAGALQASVDNALRTRRLQPSRFEDKEPAPGDSFIVLDVSVRNRGHETRVFNAGPLVVLSGGKEHRFDTPENIIADGYLLLEAIKPGAGVRGRIVYEVPSDLAGDVYWLPGNGQRLQVRASPIPLVTGSGRAQVTQAIASRQPMPRASTASASTAHADDVQSKTAAALTAAPAPAQLRQLACRALVEHNDPAERARYREFLHQQCKDYSAPAASKPRVAVARVAGANAPAATPPVHASGTPQRIVARETPDAPPQAVPSDSGPSFDCAQAVGRAEHLVCEDALLSLLDRELAQAISDAERKVADPTALLRDQDDWRARVRDACQTLPCLERAYAQRTAGLRAIGGFADVK